MNNPYFPPLLALLRQPLPLIRFASGEVRKPLLIALWAVLLMCATAPGDERRALRVSGAPALDPVTVGVSPGRRPEKPLPPLPPDVAEVRFRDFFLQPIGARGLEVTEKLKQLDGKRVRILGYMVQREQSFPGIFVLSPLPVQTQDQDSELADDLPPCVMYVSSPAHRDRRVPHTSDLLLLTGKLSLGNQVEADGRISTVRLALDEKPSSGQKHRATALGRRELGRL